LNARAVLAWLGLFAPALFVACEAGDVAVFSEASAGAPGSAGAVTDVQGGAGGSLAGAVSAQAGALPMGVAQAGDSNEAGAPPDEIVCHRPEDCPTGRFCAKSTCQDLIGVCEPQTLFCDSSALPVCGCNHVTYWNDCLRRQHGVAASTDGECGADAKACASNAECDRGTCAHLLLPPATCADPAGPGTCWVTPPDCSATTDLRGWQPCVPPQVGSGGAGQIASGGSGPCASTCEALRDGRPYVALDGSAACP
jgi:hypothetical protein